MEQELEESMALELKFSNSFFWGGPSGPTCFRTRILLKSGPGGPSK